MCRGERDAHKISPMDLATWTRERNTLASDVVPRVRGDRDASISVVLPTLNEAESISTVVRGLAAHRDAGYIEEVIVVDGGSSDDSAYLAAAAGATVVDQGDVLPAFGPILGKGDAMWRSLAIASGDIVVFFDADLANFDPNWASAVANPLLENSTVNFVKTTFDRPFQNDHRSAVEEAGRVTQMAARPLISMFYPELGAFHQPLSGQIAARRSYLDEMKFTTYYGVDIGLLIDAYERSGLDGIAQVDLGTIENRHRDVTELSEMATHIYRAVFARLAADGRFQGSLSDDPSFLVDGGDGIELREAEVIDRPPMSTIVGSA